MFDLRLHVDNFERLVQPLCISVTTTFQYCLTNHSSRYAFVFSIPQHGYNFTTTDMTHYLLFTVAALSLTREFSLFSVLLTLNVLSWNCCPYDTIIAIVCCFVSVQGNQHREFRAVVSNCANFIELELPAGLLKSEVESCFNPEQLNHIVSSFLLLK